MSRFEREKKKKKGERKYVQKKTIVVCPLPC
jgi:hypothetical protein